MRTKKFKTVAGYLRSASDEWFAASAHAELRGIKLGITVDDFKRQKLEHLLPQIGIGKPDPMMLLEDGLSQLKVNPDNARHEKTLDTCIKWVRSLGERRAAVRFLSVSEIEKPTRPLMKVMGFNRSNHGENVVVLVDESNTRDYFERAQAIGGENYCFHASMNMSARECAAVPDDCIGVMMTPAQLIERVPELDSSPEAMRKRRAAARKAAKAAQQA